MGYDIRQFGPGSDFYKGEPGLEVTAPLDDTRDVAIRTHSARVHVRVRPRGRGYSGMEVYFGSMEPVSQVGYADDLRELAEAFNFLANKLGQE